jgi:hypothetical protein
MNVGTLCFAAPSTPRHGRACPGHPRLYRREKKDLDARHKAGHDDKITYRLIASFTDALRREKRKRAMSRCLALSAMLIVLLAVPLSAAHGQCSGRSMLHCESQCGVVLPPFDPAAPYTPGVVSPITDPVCVQACNDTCPPAPPPHRHCPASDACINACPLIPAQMATPGATTVISDPACTRLCPAC